MHALQYLNNTILNFKSSTDTKLYKIKYIILEQHYLVDRDHNTEVAARSYPKPYNAHG